MEHVEPALHEQAAQGEGPPQVHAGGPPEVVHGHPGGLHGRDESILSGQDEGDLVVKARPVPAGHHVDEQALRAPEAETLDEEKDPGSGGDGAGAAGIGHFPWSHGAMVAVSRPDLWLFHGRAH